MTTPKHAVIIGDTWCHSEEDLSPLIAYYDDDFNLVVVQSLNHGSFPHVTFNQDELLQLLALFGTEEEADSEVAP